MAIKVGTTAFDLIMRYARKRLATPNAEGIMEVMSNKQAMDFVKDLVNEFNRFGVPESAITKVDDVGKFANQIVDIKQQRLMQEFKKQMTPKKSADIIELQTGKKIDQSKGIMGGRQFEETEDQIKARIDKQNKETIARIKMVDDAIDDASTGFSGDRKIDAELVAENLAQRRGLVYDDLSTRERAKIYGEAFDALSKKFRDDLAIGGRVGLFLGTTPKIAKGLSELRELLNFFGKSSDTVKKPSDILAIVNPKRLNKYLEDAKGKILKKGIMATDLLRDFQTKMSKDRIKTVKEMLESAKNIRQSEVQQAKLTNKIIEELMSKGADRQTAKSLASALSNLAENVAGKQSGVPKLTDEGILQLENVIKNLETGGKKARELNATGGRVGLKNGMSRRKFMQIMGGLAALPVVGKFFKTGKVASPVVEKAAEAASGAPSYFFDLVEKIKLLGVRSKGFKERSESFRYKDYDMDIDYDTGDIQIKKTREAMIPGGDEAGIAEESIMVYRPGRADELTKGKTPPDEYDEYTARPDMDGKMKDVDDGLSENVEKEIIDEVSEKMAGGGIARMLGE